MIYREYKSLNYPEFEAEVLKFWKENKIFEKSVESRDEHNPFVFYEGPPSANGMPGIHHVMARTIKDIFCRFKTLQGYRVNRKAGWDTHGLPVELQVEKELGITKDDIGKSISIAEYNQKCRETVMRYTSKWEELTELMGYWVDMKNPYVTYHNDYIESVWWLLKQFHENDLLYKGFTVQPYSPKAGTGLSSHELNLPGCYRDVTDTSITAQFKIIPDWKWDKIKKQFVAFDAPKTIKNAQYPVYFLAWTTTPWTLPSNCALAVGEKISYVQVRTFNPYTFQPVELILAKELLAKHFNEKAKDLQLSDYKAGDKLIPYQLVAEYKGADLEGWRFEQLMPYISNQNLLDNAWRVLLGDFVTTEDGTGIVHTASVFGADDFRVCQQNGVPSVMVIGEDGRYEPLVNKQGQFVAEFKEKINIDLRQIALKHGKQENEFDLPKYMKPEYEEEDLPANYYASDVLISILLKEQNKAFKVEKYVHTYPHCWRTDKPVLYYPLDSWFIRTTAKKDRLVELNKTINWKPESTGTGRFGNWLENLVDWNLSRQRYWGVPLPVWRTEDGKEEKCIGSVEELQREIEKAGKMNKQVPLSTEIELHRPYVDEIVLISEAGKPMYREPDLIDVWFDSGAMPYAQNHYPFNKKLFKDGAKTSPSGIGGLYPADFISEAVDQTRGWFFTLHAIAVMLFDSVAFKNVISTGLLLDKDGRKMSKRLGNVIDPFEALKTYGADPVRWFMVENTTVGENIKFDLEGVKEVQRRFYGTLYNTYQFYALYANIDRFKLDEFNLVPVAQRHELDRWILSKLQNLIKEVSDNYEDYEPTKVVRLIQNFVNDHLSNWYVRLSRKRFWMGEMTVDKKAAYETLHECLVVIAQLMSPVSPFIGEWLYKNMTDPIREQAKAKNTPLQYDSVHLTHLVKAEKNLLDTDLEEKMDLAQRISSLTHSLRKKANIRVRQPLSKVLIPVLDNKIKTQIEAVREIILAEVNIKNIEFLADDHEIVVKSVKPNFKTLGVKYKQQMKEVSQLIQQFSPDDIALIEKEGKLAKNGFDLLQEDVLILSEDVKGLSVVSENGLTVALDLTLTEDLRKEGIARDIVNRVQNLRKDSGLEVMDKIKISIQNPDPFVREALLLHKDYICTETQALEMEFVDNLKDGEELELEEFKLRLKIVH